MLGWAEYDYESQFLRGSAENGRRSLPATGIEGVHQALIPRIDTDLDGSLDTDGRRLAGGRSPRRLSGIIPRGPTIEYRRYCEAPDRRCPVF
jgi:hypothetical protein